jgi:hypothetical protein
MKSETLVSVVFLDVIPGRSLAAAVRRIANKLVATNARYGRPLAGDALAHTRHTDIFRRTAAAVMVFGALISMPAVAENTVRFSGSVVHATCNIQPVSQSGLQLAQGVNVRIETSRNACDGQAVPFVAYYTPVQQSAPTDKTLKAGVVTVTYQ